MAASAQEIGFRELTIQSSDGSTRSVPLVENRYSLGRAASNELCYADDSGLSRQHLSIERDGSRWVLRDLGSKNGTFVNGNRLKEPHVIGVGDRITAGHLLLQFGEKSSPLDYTVVFVESAPALIPSTTVGTSLEGLLTDEKEIQGGGHMHALINAGRELAGHKPLNELFELIMNLSIKAVRATRGVLMTLEGEELCVRAATGEGFRISSTVRDSVIKERRSLLVRDARLDQAFADRMSIVQQQVRSILAVPLQTDSRVIGLIYLDSPDFVHEFTRDDLNLLTVMANVAAIRIEHARLAEVEQAERMLANELEQAAYIQRRLLPAEAPPIAGFDLAGYNVACRTVGGDYYDFLKYEDGRVGIIVGDVAGKGMPAALLVSSLQARVQVLFDEPDNLAARVSRLNRSVKSNCPDNRFITFFIGILDPSTGELTYANAGHNPPILIRQDGSFERLEATGLILGIMAGAPYAHQNCRLNPGDLLVVFSDGVSEACAANSENEFGDERLIEVLRDAASEPAQAMIESVVRHVKEFIAGAPPSDDVTLVVAKRLK